MEKQVWLLQTNVIEIWGWAVSIESTVLIVVEEIVEVRIVFGNCRENLGGSQADIVAHGLALIALPHTVLLHESHREVQLQSRKTRAK